MTDVWVVNASPLISLAKVGRLDLLARSDRALLVPEAVAREVLAGPEGDPARRALEGGFSPVRATVVVPAEVLEWGLGAGESAVIALAKEQGGCAVLDDGEARACARTLGVPLIGTLGVVLRARREGRIHSAAVVLTALRAAGLRLDDAVIRKALQASVGEDWKGDQ